MRSLEECKAEVFRRSEERIKNKKKTNIKRVVVASLSTAAGIVLTVCAIRFISVIEVKTKENYYSYDSNNPSNSQMSGSGGLGTENEIVNMDSLAEAKVDFEVQYIRGSQWGDVDYPSISILKSVAELNQYLELNTDENLQKNCMKYDKEYFEEQILVVYRISESSGSTRHNVKSLTITGNKDNKKLVVGIERLRAEVGTCDMAEWYIVIETATDFDIDEEDIEIKNMMRGV